MLSIFVSFLSLEDTKHVKTPEEKKREELQNCIQITRRAIVANSNNYISPFKAQPIARRICLEK